MAFRTGLIWKSSHNFFRKDDSARLAGIFPPGGSFEMVNVSKEGQVFECEICGNVVVVKTAGGGELVCCGQPMNLVKE